MTVTGHLLPALLLAGLSAVLAVAIPRVVRGLPEPEDPQDKIPYAELGVRPGLWWRCCLAAAAVGAIAGAGVGLQGVLVPLAWLVPVGVALAYVDWQTMFLPTKIIAPSYGALVLSLIIATTIDLDTDNLIRAVGGWLAWGILFGGLWLLAPRSLGYGDVRLSGLIGLLLGYLGWSEVITGIYAAFLAGGIGGLVLFAFRRNRRFPFGPFMLVGALVAIVTGSNVTRLIGF